MKKAILKGLAVIVCLFAIGTWSCAQQRSDSQAPDFTVTTIDGKEMTLSALEAKVTIIDFFATWCPPCRMEIPHFVDLYNQYSGQGCAIIGISVDTGAEPLAKFIQDYGITYPVAHDSQGIGDRYGPIRSIPTTFVLDQNKQIVKTYIGYRDKEVFEQDIKELLGK